jgi:tetratricopeptide (TPR) repeat protein
MMQRFSLAGQARRLWQKAKLSRLVELCQSPRGAKNPEVLYYGGLAYSGLNDPVRAIKCWHNAVNLRPTYDRVLRSLAYAFSDWGAPAFANHYLQRLVELGAATSDDLTLLGENLVKLNDLSRARQWLQKALQEDADNTLALLALASVYVRLGESQRALTLLKRVAESRDLDMPSLRGDPDFKPLADNREFLALTSE